MTVQAIVVRYDIAPATFYKYVQEVQDDLDNKKAAPCEATPEQPNDLTAERNLKDTSARQEEQP